MKKHLGLIITAAYKSNELVKELLELLNKNKELFDVVFVYENSKDFNYDWVELEYDFKTIKTEGKYKNKKIIEGSQKLNSKYFTVIDADDLIEIQGIKNFILQTINIDVDMIINNVIFRQGFKKIVNTEKVDLSNSAVIYSTNTFVKNIYEMTNVFANEIDSMYNQDLVIALIYNSIAKPTIYFSYEPYYIHKKNYTNSTSNKISKMYKDSEALKEIAIFYKNLLLKLDTVLILDHNSSYLNYVINHKILPNLLIKGMFSLYFDIKRIFNEIEHKSLQKIKNIGILKYDKAFYVVRNIGDYIQSLAAWQYYQQKNVKFIDRENLSKKMNENTLLIANGWFLHRKKKFDEIFDSNKISYKNVLLSSIHLDPRINPEDIKNNKFFQEYSNVEKINTRDTNTLKILKEINLNSEFEGCLTLTLNKYRFTNDYNFSNGKILFNIDQIGTKNKLKKAIRKDIKEKTNIKSSRDVGVNIHTRHFTFTKFIFWRAKRRLKLIANSELIVTNRLHSFLPATAMGKKAIFVFSEKNTDKNSRYGGLIKEIGLWVKYENNKLVDTNISDFRNIKPTEKHLVYRNNLKNKVVDFVNSNIKK